MTRLEVLFSPAEFEALGQRDLSQTTCVVFDVLRATSSIVTALAHGAAAILPVATIEAALAERKKNPDILLAGERDGFRITSKLTGSVDFDFGNSPREFTGPAVQGKTIVMTTTNGTRALQACRGAREILVGSFLNLSRLAEHLRSTAVTDLLLVCSGTYEEASYEDLLGAGALADSIWDQFCDGHLADSAQIARHIFQAAQSDLLASIQHARNGRRLLALPDLREDVAFCILPDQYPILSRMDPAGQVRRDLE